MGAAALENAKVNLPGCCEGVGTEGEMKFNLYQTKTMSKADSQSTMPTRALKDPPILVQNVHTGSHHDIRWHVDREQSTRGSSGQSNLGSEFIDEVLND